MLVTLARLSDSSKMFMVTVGTSDDLFITIDTTGGRPALWRKNERPVRHANEARTRERRNQFYRCIIDIMCILFVWCVHALGVDESEAGLDGDVAGPGHVAVAQDAADLDRLVSQALDYRVELDDHGRPDDRSGSAKVISFFKIMYFFCTWP